MNSELIKTSRLELRPFSRSDITEDYVHWLNDPEISQYLESGGINHTLESVSKWVEWSNNDPSRMLFGIFYSNKHIGNLTFYQIDNHHRCARIGITIGKKELWGMGLASEAIVSATNYAFHKLMLHRIEAGVYEPNVSSQRLFIKSGFHLESKMKERIYFEKRFVDMLLYVKIST